MKGYPSRLPYFQEDTVVAAGGTVNRYLFALEGWRRGLRLRVHRKKVLLRSDERRHYFTGRVDLVSKDAKQTCIDKDLTRQCLAKAGVPVPLGKRFRYSCEVDEMTKYADNLGFPVVLKPHNGSTGRGVVVNIPDRGTLKKEITNLRKTLGKRDLIVEKYFNGDDYRVLVQRNRVVGAIKRIPANITGNGKDSIDALISQKNFLRKKNPYLAKRLINVDREVIAHLAQQGYKLKSRPASGELVYLRSKCNLAAGGDPIDVTDEIPGYVRDLAIQAVQAVPGLPGGGVDILVNEKEKRACVIEINGAPQLGMHLFPIKGQARDVVGAILDDVFPEAKPRSQSVALVINFSEIQQILDSGAVTQVTVSPYPQGELKALRLIVSGKVQGVGFRRWVHKKATSLKISGHVQNLDNGDVELVVAGNVNCIEEFKTSLAKTKKFPIKKISESSWNKPICIGFKIIR